MFLWTQKTGPSSSPRGGGAIAAVDVGTAKACCFLARVESSGEVCVSGIGHHLSRGLSAGTVVDLKATEESVRAAVAAAEKMAGEEVRGVYLSVSGGRQASQTIGVEVTVTGRQVMDSDIRRAAEHAMVRAHTDEREVVHAIPVSYSIDGATGIRDPRGMFGGRIGVTLHVITADSSQVRNLAVSAGRGHVDVRGLVASGYAAGLATLIHDEAELGATVLDMGAGITNIAVFSGGAPVLVDSVPIGGQEVTNDIARTLGTSVAHAERMKTLFGSAIVAPGDTREMIEAPTVGESPRAGASQVSRAELARVIAPRIEELFEQTAARLASVDALAGRRLVLTGGASQLDGVSELAARVLDKHVRIGRPIHVAGLAESMGGPTFAACAGMLQYAATGAADRSVAALVGDGVGGGTLAGIGRWLRQNL